MADMERRFQEISSGSSRMLPSPGRGWLPDMQGPEFQIDVREHENEVLVVADLPGVGKEGISIRLQDPQTLLIATERRGERDEERENYYLRERSFGSLSRTVTLPSPVTEQDASASFKNGVLEVRLQKRAEAQGKRIAID